LEALVRIDSRTFLQGLDDYPFLVSARTALFDQLVWWARALKTARAATGVMESFAD
jgi:hypothetical protein